MSRGFNWGTYTAKTAAILAQTRQNQDSSMSPKDREELAYRSSIGRSLRKSNPAVAPIAGKDIYETNQRNQLKLAFLILTYLYSQDDQKLSRKELRDIKELIKTEAPDFSSDDLIEVYGYFDELPDANFVLRFVANNHISERNFYAANDLVLANFRNKKVYTNLLRDLRKKYKSNQALK